MKFIIERFFIKILKIKKTDLLAHAHVQIGVGHNTYQSGEENFIKNVLFRILKKEPKIILDVGANSGEYAMMLADRFKSAKIYCFEPIPANYQNLIKNTAGLNTINILSAVGSQKGNIKLYMGEKNTDGTMATSYKEILDTIFSFLGDVNQVIDSPVITIDDFFGDQTDEIDFLKIDVEGHELEVLKGASDHVNKNKIKVIQFEFNEFNIFSKSFMKDFYQLLNAYNFYRIMPSGSLYPMGSYSTSHEIFRYQNILAIHNTLNYAN
jgi:FkbM family methyltransferase